MSSATKIKMFSAYLSAPNLKNSSDYVPPVRTELSYHLKINKTGNKNALYNNLNILETAEFIKLKWVYELPAKMQRI